MKNGDLEKAVLKKLIGMFSPSDFSPCIGHAPSDVICGPNDRAVIGFQTYFPKKWLMEDYGFTAEEVDFLFRAVKQSEPAKAVHQ